MANAKNEYAGAHIVPAFNYRRPNGEVIPVILFGREKDGAYKGAFNLIGGKREHGSKGDFGIPFNTACRETTEEAPAIPTIRNPLIHGLLSLSSKEPTFYLAHGKSA